MFLLIEWLKLVDLCLDQGRDLNLELFVTWPVWSGEALYLELKRTILTLSCYFKCFDLILGLLQISKHSLQFLDLSEAAVYL